ncbi:Plasma membrane sulfite pump involved in sulfite metabolism [Pichia californica]|nr:Plasma membrane sulfite pump involved in sulfite metabolism [[Candida] californica]
MGIGITSGVMYNFPIESIRRGLKYIGIIYFFINLFVIIINHLLFSLKYLIFPYILKNDKRYQIKLFDLMHKPQLSVFLGASQMSFVTMVNMLHYLRPNWIIANFVLWWIVFFQSMCCVIFVTFFNFSNFTNPIKRKRKKKILNNINNDIEKQNLDDISINSLHSINSSLKSKSKLKLKSKFKSITMDDRFNSIVPVLMLPLVTCTVTASSGGLILSTLEDSKLMISMIIILIMLLSIALIGSFLCLNVIFVRLYIMGLPKNNLSFTLFVPIGLMGQSSWGYLLVSKEFIRTIKKGGFKIIGMKSNEMNSNFNSNLFENIIMIMSLIISISLIAFGILLTIWSILGVLYWYIGFPRIGKFKEKFLISNYDKKIYYIGMIFWSPTMWAATFPLATISLSSHEIFNITELIGFKILSTIYGISVIIITTWCMIGTFLFIVPWGKIRGVYNNNNNK